MEPISLNRILETGFVKCNEDGLIVAIPTSWIIDGENRLSYASLVRLIECCREYHWQKDILSIIDSKNFCLDSISKSLSCEFINPIIVGSTIFISYSIIKVRSKGYELKFEVRNNDTDILYANFFLISIFYNPSRCKSIIPPDSVLNYLSTQYSESE